MAVTQFFGVCQVKFGSDFFYSKLISPRVKLPTAFCHGKSYTDEFLHCCNNSGIRPNLQAKFLYQNQAFSKYDLVNLLSGGRLQDRPQLAVEEFLFPYYRHHLLTDFEVVDRIFNMMDKVFNIGYFTHYVRYRTDCNVGNIQAAKIIKTIVVILWCIG